MVRVATHKLPRWPDVSGPPQGGQDWRVREASVGPSESPSSTGLTPSALPPTGLLETELGRVAGRLRASSLDALGRPVGRWGSRADAAYAVAQALADAAADLEKLPRRALPRLPDSVVADQVAVCGADLLTAGHGNAPADVLDLLVEVRRAL